MKTWMGFAAALVLFVPVGSEASDMSRVVRAVETDLGVHHTHIPILGMAIFVGRVATGFQMPGVKLAVFQNEKLSQSSPQQLERTVWNALGPEWNPLVKSTSNHGDEQNWIFAREEGRKLHMFIATAERGEISLVEVNVSDRQMQRWIKDTDTMSRNRH
jgi:hypothetical protein